jgi:hypothetical protein
MQWVNRKWLAFDASNMARRLAAENRAETERCFFPSQSRKN